MYRQQFEKCEKNALSEIKNNNKASTLLGYRCFEQLMVRKSFSRLLLPCSGSMGQDRWKSISCAQGGFCSSNSTQEVLGCASEGFRLSCIPGLFCRTGEEECWLIVRLFLVQTEAASVPEYLRQECVTALLLALTSSQSRWAQGKPPPHLPQPPIEVAQKWKERPNPVRFTKKQPDFTVAITSVAYSIWP